MTSTPVLRSAFVPHDLEAPVAGAAQGPLAGLTAAVKDMYDIAGYVAGGGSPDWLATHRPATKNCPAVQQILDAGATVIGKTVCDEFFFSVTGMNAHYGTPVNPRAVGRVPGGSSSGSASATAAGACDFALGSDTGGSVRMPASFCGLYGLRPTHGRVDLSGAMPMAPSFDVAGWFAGSPGVFRKVGAVLLGGKAAGGAIRNLVLVDDAFAESDPEVAAFVNAALEAMAGELPGPRRERVAPDGLEAWREIFRICQGWEIWKIYGDFITREKPKLGPGVRERIHLASAVTEEEGAKAAEARARARAHIRALVTPGTLLALPTSPTIAPRTDMPGPEQDAWRLRVIRMTSISGISGLPQVTIPVGTVAGAPVGLSFIGWENSDEVLLDLAVRLARYCGGYLG
jgi:amidase